MYKKLQKNSVQMDISIKTTELISVQYYVPFYYELQFIFLTRE